jgi:CubicO group peptidase (beta-lactamase class C family)
LANQEIQGTCDSRFEGVREVFAAQFAAGTEIGAAAAVTVDGVPVLDLWGGVADPASGRPWQRDTLVNVYSTTKGMTALAALRLVESGALDLDRPVSAYWPEFAAAGKEDLPVHMLFSHRAGLAAIRETLPFEALFDWQAMTGALAAEEPWWPAGTSHGYHAVTFGWLVGELVRRVTGRSLGTYFAEEIAGPLGLDFHIGLAAGEDARVATLGPLSLEEAPGEPSLAQIILADMESVTARAFTNPPSLLMPETVNSRQWRGAEIPGANGHSDARSLARVYGALAVGGDLDGVHVLAPAIRERAREVESDGEDLVLKVNSRFGLGFMLPHDGMRLGPNAGAFGHPGAGGSLGFADPEARVGFGYIMNRMGPHILLDPRPRALIEAVYAAL